jgi:hypothetical protein
MATNTSISTSLTDVPAVLKPYITDAGGILPSAQKLLTQDYATTYGNPLAAAGLAGSGRIAGLSPMQQQIGTQLQGMTTPNQFAQGNTAVQSGLGALGQSGNMYGNIGNVNAPDITMYQAQGPQSYTGSNVSQYMSPYQQQVVDVQKQEAFRDAQKGLVAQNLASSKQGTYGGARNALMQTEADRNLQTQLGNIQAVGSQNAFQNAQQQFNTSQQQQQTANLANLQAALGTQQLSAGQSLESQKANQAAALQSAQGLGQLGSVYGNLGQTYGALGTAQQASDIDRIKTQGAFGDLQRATQQQQLDSQYQDLMTKLNYPLTSLETMNNLVRGVPLTQTATSGATTTPPPSFASQLAGTGLTGLSLYNMFGSGK